MMTKTNMPRLDERQLEKLMELARTYGRKQPTDKALAFHLYLCAAQAGHAAAQCELGCWYDAGGDGVQVDTRQAAYWLKQSAEGGNLYAMHFLGKMYCVGRGVEQDWEEGRKWLKQAMEGGNEEARDTFEAIFTEES